MASLELVSTQMFDCVPRNCNRKKKDLKVFVRDPFNNFREFLVDDSGSNADGKSKEVLECSSRSSVSETKESLPIPFWKPNPTSSPLETNSNSFYNPGQPENPSRNDINMGASSLVQIWEARSQQSSSSNSSSFSESLNDEAKHKNDDIDWCSQSDRSYVSDSWEKEREARNFLQLVACTPRIRGRQAFADFLIMILRERKKELKWLATCYAVSKFSPRGCERLQYMLRIRCFERCITIQERHQSKSGKRYSRGSGVMNLRDRYKTNTGKVNSAVETRVSSSPVSSRVTKVYKMANKAADKNVLLEKTERLKETTEKSNPRRTQEATCKPKIAKIAILSEDSSINDGLKKPEIERKVTEKGETIEKVIVKESVEMEKTSILSIVEKVNLWDAKERSNRRRNTEKAKNEGKGARRFIDVEEIVERKKETRKKEEVSSFEEGKSREIEEYRINPQEVTRVISFDKRKEEETARRESRESGKEEKSSQGDEETPKAEKQEALSFILESPRFLNGWDEKEMQDEEDEDYSGEYYDWVSNISRPRSYWDDLRKQREVEVMMNKDPKKDAMRKLIKKRTVSTFLESDFREKIDKILISRAQEWLQVEINPEEEEDSGKWMVECSTRYQENLEENETEKIGLETVTVSDGFSQSSAKSTMMTRSFEDHEAAITSLSISTTNLTDHENTSSYETDMICDLREQIKQLQREMLELKSLVKSCVDFQKSAKIESFSGVDICARV